MIFQKTNNQEPKDSQFTIIYCDKDMQEILDIDCYLCLKNAKLLFDYRNNCRLIFLIDQL